MAVPLRQLRAIRSEQQGEVCVDGHRSLHRLGEEDVLRRRRQDVLPPHDVGDAVVDIVHGAGQVVGRRAVGSEDHEVVDLGVVELHLSPYDVCKDGGARPGHGEAHRGRLAGSQALLRLGITDAISAVVGGGAAGRLGLLAEGIKLLRRLERVVGAAGGHQRRRHLLIAGQAVALAICAVWSADLDSLVPIDAEPAQAVDDVPPVFVGAPLLVGVVAAQDQRAALAPSEEPVVEGGPPAPDVEVTRRRRGKPDPDGHLSTTGFTRTPTPSTSTSTRSPGSIGPTPEGVPVRITSPGSSVMMELTNETSSPIPKIMSDVDPA